MNPSQLEKLDALIEISRRKAQELLSKGKKKHPYAAGFAFLNGRPRCIFGHLCREVDSNLCKFTNIRSNTDVLQRLLPGAEIPVHLSMSLGNLAESNDACAPSDVLGTALLDVVQELERMKLDLVPELERMK